MVTVEPRFIEPNEVLGITNDTPTLSNSKVLVEMNLDITKPRYSKHNSPLALRYIDVPPYLFLFF